MALPCCGRGSPRLHWVGALPFLDLALGVKVVPASEWVGPRLSGLVFGPSFSRWGCWPFLLGVGVILRVGFGPVFLVWVLALPSNWPFLPVKVS